MAKPRRSTAEAFYDVFTDFSVEDQAIALKIMEQIHRQATREKRRTPKPQDAQLPLADQTASGDAK